VVALLLLARAQVLLIEINLRGRQVLMAAPDPPAADEHDSEAHLGRALAEESAHAVHWLVPIVAQLPQVQ